MEVEGVEGEHVAPRDPYSLPEADSSAGGIDEHLDPRRIFQQPYPGRVENDCETPPDPDPSPMADLSDDGDEPADYVGFLEHIEVFRSPSPPAIVPTVPKIRVPKLDFQRMYSSPLIRGDHFKTASVRLSNITKGCSTGSVTVEFSSENIIPSKGLIRVSFPPGFGLSSAYLKEVTGIPGGLTLSKDKDMQNNNTLTLTRRDDHGQPTKPGQSIELVLYNIINPWEVGSIGFFTIATFASRDDPTPISQRMFVSRVCIVERTSSYNDSVLSQTPSPSYPGPPEPLLPWVDPEDADDAQDTRDTRDTRNTRYVHDTKNTHDTNDAHETHMNQKPLPRNVGGKEPCGEDTPYMAKNVVRDFALRFKACTQKYCRVCI